MMTLAWALLAIGGLLSLVGWILLLVAAFRVSTGWGLAILLLSWTLIPVIVFAVRYWPEAKPGVLATVGGTVVTVLGWFFAFGAVAGEVMHEIEQAELEGIDAGVPAGPPSSGEPLPTATPVPVVPTATPTPTSPPEPAQPFTDADEPGADRTPDAEEPRRGERDDGWGREVTWDAAAEYVGERVEIHKTDGERIRASLLAIADDGLRLRQRVGGGAITYTLPRHLVSHVRVAD